MAKLANPFDSLVSKAKDAAGGIDVEALKSQAASAGEMIGTKAGELKDAAIATKEDINDKLTELDRMLDRSITDYNDAYTLMSDKGLQLYIERLRSTDELSLAEALVNSIANHPKSFNDDFATIDTDREEFQDACDFADRELRETRRAAGGAGAGLAAGASVAFMAPTAAMWVATTFGVASTGTAISTLSGAAAANAALAWLGGGALAAGGGGVAGGTALLALAGPVGWTIAGATLLSSIVLFSTNRQKLNKQKNEEIEEVKRNTERIRELDAQIGAILNQTHACREGLNGSVASCLELYRGDYGQFDATQKKRLGAMVNNALALSALFGKTVEERDEAVQDDAVRDEAEQDGESHD